MKYRLTDSIKMVEGKTLHQIRACCDIPLHGIHAGDLGGFVESERNLSQDDACWLVPNACVYDAALLCQSAYASGSARVNRNAVVYGMSELNDYVLVTDNSRLRDHTILYDNVTISDNVRVSGHVVLAENVRLRDNARVRDCGVLDHNALVGGNANIQSDRDVFYIQTYIDDAVDVTFYKTIDNSIGVAYKKNSSYVIESFLAAIELQHGTGRIFKFYKRLCDSAKIALG
jgi:carbonic anhydrase/acetyltransferase-like protein (isoleucine patch superfamily)